MPSDEELESSLGQKRVERGYARINGRLQVAEMLRGRLDREHLDSGFAFVRHAPDRQQLADDH